VLLIYAIKKEKLLIYEGFLRFIYEFLPAAKSVKQDEQN